MLIKNNGTARSIPFLTIIVIVFFRYISIQKRITPLS